MAGDRQQLCGLFDRFLDVAAAELLGVGEAVDEVDDEKGGFLAETDAVSESLLFVDGGIRGVVRVDGHGGSLSLIRTDILAPTENHARNNSAP